MLCVYRVQPVRCGTCTCTRVPQLIDGLGGLNLFSVIFPDLRTEVQYNSMHHLTHCVARRHAHSAKDASVA
jgi:hypothetical protein